MPALLREVTAVLFVLLLSSYARPCLAGAAFGKQTQSLKNKWASWKARLFKGGHLQSLKNEWISWDDGFFERRQFRKHMTVSSKQGLDRARDWFFHAMRNSQVFLAHRPDGQLVVRFVTEKRDTQGEIVDMHEETVSSKFDKQGYGSLLFRKALPEDWWEIKKLIVGGTGRSVPRD